MGAGRRKRHPQKQHIDSARNPFEKHGAALTVSPLAKQRIRKGRHSVFNGMLFRHAESSSRRWLSEVEPPAVDVSTQMHFALSGVYHPVQSAESVSRMRREMKRQENEPEKAFIVGECGAKRRVGQRRGAGAMMV